MAPLAGGGPRASDRGLGPVLSGSVLRLDWMSSSTVSFYSYGIAFGRLAVTVVSVRRLLSFAIGIWVFLRVRRFRDCV